MIDVSIVIVSWNVADLLAECLDSVRASSLADTVTVEIIVVDSASHDNTVSMLHEQYPQVQVLAQSENVGFTRGNNIGFAEAQGRYIFMLNPDTVIHGGAIGAMVRYLDAHPQVGIVGPHTLNSDGTYQSSRRRFPTRPLAFFESTWLQSIAPRAMLDRFYVKDAPPTTTLDVDWVQGSALMIRHEIYQQIGGLDAGYVMYFEELDWCKRAKDAGWRVVYLGDVQITHHGGKSSEQVQAFKHIHYQQSKLRYYRKHHGAGFAYVLQAFLLVQYAWQLLLEGAKGLIGSKRQLRRARVQTYWQVLRSGLKVT